MKCGRKSKNPLFHILCNVDDGNCFPLDLEMRNNAVLKSSCLLHTWSAVWLTLQSLVRTSALEVSSCRRNALCRNVLAFNLTNYEQLGFMTTVSVMLTRCVMMRARKIKLQSSHGEMKYIVTICTKQTGRVYRCYGMQLCASAQCDITASTHAKTYDNIKCLPKFQCSFFCILILLCK